MTMATIVRSERPLSFAGARAFLLEGIFIAATVAAPLAAHALGWPVFRVLPMFWGVMLAGAVYGWKAGLIAGLTAPVLNHLLTGMPALPMVPLMAIELALYGALPAILASKALRGNLYLAMAVAGVAGRMVIVGGFLLFLGGSSALPGFLASSVIPGVPMQIVQVLTVPVIAGAIVRSAGRSQH